MDVYIGVIELSRIDSEIHGLCLHETQRSLRTLLHHITQLTGQDQLSTSGQLRRLDEENVSAHGRPSESGRNSGDRGPLSHVVLEASGSENIRYITVIDL